MQVNSFDIKKGLKSNHSSYYFALKTDCYFDDFSYRKTKFFYIYLRNLFNIFIHLNRSRYVIGWLWK